MFRQCAKDHYKGILVSYTRVAGTQMCGHLIAALRLLRLKPALLACVRTPEFLRVKKHCMVVVALTKEVVWDFIPVAKRFTPSCALSGLLTQRFQICTCSSTMSCNQIECLKNICQRLSRPMPVFLIIMILLLSLDGRQVRGKVFMIVIGFCPP